MAVLHILRSLRRAYLYHHPVHYRACVQCLPVSLLYLYLYDRWIREAYAATTCCCHCHSHVLRTLYRYRYMLRLILSYSFCAFGFCAWNKVHVRCRYAYLQVAGACLQRGVQSASFNDGRDQDSEYTHRIRHGMDIRYVFYIILLFNMQ